jgi:hypothetical protein
MQDDQLLAQQSILHDQIRTAASYIGEKTSDQHCSGRFCPMFDTLLKPEKKIVDHAALGVLYNEGRAASYPFYSSYPVRMTHVARTGGYLGHPLWFLKQNAWNWAHALSSMHDFIIYLGLKILLFVA